MPRSLCDDLAPHDAQTVADMRWPGTPDTQLLRLAAAAGFDVLLTVDQGFVQRRRLPLTVVVLTAPSNTPAVLRPMMAEVLERLAEVERRGSEPPAI
jgi:hypothetical protein